MDNGLYIKKYIYYIEYERYYFSCYMIYYNNIY